MRPVNNRNPRKTTPLGGAPSQEPLLHTPFPGLIDQNKWTVIEERWPSFINRNDLEGEGGIMGVPLAGTDADRKLRLHEQAHVAFTPNIRVEEVRALGVQERTLNACEDARVISMMNRRSKDWEQINESQDLLPSFLRTKHERDFMSVAQNLIKRAEDKKASMESEISLLEVARLIAGSRGYFESAFFDRIAGQANLGWVVDEVEKLHDRFLAPKKEEPTFEDTIAYAQELERVFEDLAKAIQEQVDDLAELDHSLQMPQLDQGDPYWGEMIMETAPLTEPLRGDPSRRVRSTDTGAIPRYMHRLPTDQKVFGRRRKHQHFQGTVLIDLSGSMSLEPEEVDEILHRWPAVTIATYSGKLPGDPLKGKLRIVAKNGRRASIEWLNRPAKGDNLIDGPALDWLAKQKQPRVWISDGGVTGVGGQSRALLIDAGKKVRQGKIKRIPNVQELIRRSE